MSKGIAKADNPEDHQRLVETLKLMQSLQESSATHLEQPANHSGGQDKVKGASEVGLTLSGLLDKFFLFRELKEATIQSYRISIEEFADFVGKNRKIHTILKTDITRFQESLLKKGNVRRTIDNKIGTIRTLFFFAIEQAYFFGENPAANRNMLTKKQKLTGGYGIFEDDEITKIFESEFMKTAQENDLDYFWSLMLGLFTGCRISEITSLTAEQFKKSESGTAYIKLLDSKTLAGKREIPFPAELFEMGLSDFIPKSGALFKYQMRLGKGSGNAVGKKFKRHLEEAGITGEKLVFHSIRKFVNDHFLKESVPFEPRCQFFGHEVDNVNVSTYSKKFNVDQLGKVVLPVQRNMISKFLSKQPNPEPHS